MGLKATFSILPKTTVHWENNHTTREGFIYVADARPLSFYALFATLIPKLFQLPGWNLTCTLFKVYPCKSSIPEPFPTNICTGSCMVLA